MQGDPGGAVLTKTRVAAVLGAAALAAGATAPTAAGALRVEIDNRSERPDREVFVTLFCGDFAGTTPNCPQGGDGALANGKAITQNSPLRLSRIPGRAFVVPTPYTSGNIYVGFGRGIVQATPGRQSPPAATLPDPDTSTVPFGFAEFTAPAQNGADITAVDQFGIPMRLEIKRKNGSRVGTRGFVCDGNSTRKLLRAIPGSRRAEKTRGGRFLRMISPSKLGLPGTPRQAYPSLQSYINSLIGRRLSIRTGSAFGADVTFAGTVERVGGGTSITLTEVNGKAAPLTVPLTSQQIYGSNGPYSVGGTFLPGLVNDLHGEVYNRLVSGFAFGYWGGRYGNHVDDIAGTGWWRKPAFAAARRGRAPFTARAPQYSPYAAVIARASANQVYGHPFADALPNNPGALVNVPANATMKLVILPNQSKGRQPAFCTRP